MTSMESMSDTLRDALTPQGIPAKGGVLVLRKFLLFVIEESLK
jgi:hypothetical protein